MSVRSWWAQFARVEKILLAALGVALFVAVTVPLAFFVTDREQEKQAAKDLEERRIEACLSYNADQTNDRRTFIEGLGKFVIIFGDSTPESVAVALETEDGREFTGFIHSENPYRTCTPECVEAQLDPDLANCGPADNEEGKP